MCFYVTQATWALQSHDLSGEGFESDSHTYFLTTQGHGAPPWMRDQLNAGAPPRQHDQEETINHSRTQS